MKEPECNLRWIRNYCRSLCWFVATPLGNTHDDLSQFVGVIINEGRPSTRNGKCHEIFDSEVEEPKLGEE